MEEEYSPEILACLDEIIERLKQKNFITIQPGEDTEIQRICYEILVDEKWITVQRLESKIVFHINPSSSFSCLYAGGTFSKRYERKKQSQHKSINVTNSTLINSPIAQGNNINQNIFNPDISSEINNAINQIEGEESLTSQEKKDILDILEELKECVSHNQKPGKSLSKSLYKYSKKIIEIGGALANIYLMLEPLIKSVPH